MTFSYVQYLIILVICMKDIVPDIPGMFMGYRHPSGEVHLTENNKWVTICPGKNYVFQMKEKSLYGYLSLCYILSISHCW